METTKEVCQAAIETMEKVEAALQLDLMLLEMEAKQDMMDGLKLEVYL
jgi:hypothetical protein